MEENRRSEDSLKDLKKKITELIGSSTNSDRTIELMIQLEIVTLLSINTDAMIHFSKKLEAHAEDCTTHFDEHLESEAKISAVRPILLYLGRTLQGAIIAALVWAGNTLITLHEHLNTQDAVLKQYIAVQEVKQKIIEDFLSIPGDERMKRRIAK